MNFSYAWVLAAVNWLNPPADAGKTNAWGPENIETPAERSTRNEKIAQAIFAVVHDEEEKPLVKGIYAEFESASIILGIIKHEAGFRRDVYVGKGFWSKGDGGNSYCLMQRNLGKTKSPEGWYGPELLGDVGIEKCIRSGYHRIRESIKACPGVTWVDYLTNYASGNCTSAEGHEKSTVRMTTAAGIFKKFHPKTFVLDGALSQN